LLIAVVLEMVAWIGALVKTAQLGRWGWFICMLIPFINSFAFLGYVLFGPTESARPVPVAPLQPYSYSPYGAQPGQSPYGRPD
jgi:hypothetical protein